MIDKIIDIYERKNDKEISNLKKEIIETHNARFMFIFAYYFQEYLDDEFNKILLETNDKRYITFMFRQIKNIDEEEYFNKILEFDNKDIFYSLFDKRITDASFYIKALDMLSKREMDKYFVLTLYLYFCLLNQFDEKVFSYLKQIDENVNDTNYMNFLKCFVEENKEKIPGVSGFTKNCYIGHNGYIPDMIVLHISFDYGRILSTFFDEKSEVSSHFVISKTGTVFNPVSLENSSWANGTSIRDQSDIYYRFSESDIIRDRCDNCNYYSYSIENESFDGSLTEDQYNSLINTICSIIDYIKDTYKVDFKIDEEHIIGHHNVNPIVRVSCPGVNFPMKKIIKDVRKIYEKV